jgi:hypothetical protein
MEAETACNTVINTDVIISPEIKANNATFVIVKVGRPAQISKLEIGKIAPKKSGFDLNKLLTSKKFTQKDTV